jgi:hypothetical protein
MGGVRLGFSNKLVELEMQVILWRVLGSFLL